MPVRVSSHEERERLAAASTDEARSGLGVPQRITFSVPDVCEARDQLARATGTRFGPVTTLQTPVQLPDERHPRIVTLHSALSVRGGAFLEVVQVEPRIGPWVVDGATPVLSYSVTDLHDAVRDARLHAAGLRRTASAPEFVFWQGEGGITIRLFRGPVGQIGGGGDQVRAPIDLGPVVSCTLSLWAPDRVRMQLGAALGLQWARPVKFTFPWVWADGSKALLDATVQRSGAGPTYLTLETPRQAPTLPAYASFPGRTPAHLVFLTDDVFAADRQLHAAGMRLIGRVPSVISYFEGSGGILVQAMAGHPMSSPVPGVSA